MIWLSRISTAPGSCCDLLFIRARILAFSDRPDKGAEPLLRLAMHSDAQTIQRPLLAHLVDEGTQLCQGHAVRAPVLSQQASLDELRPLMGG
jgi:hypothetical protein